jgi:hypothetical protein
MADMLFHLLSCSLLVIRGLVGKERLESGMQRDTLMHYVRGMVVILLLSLSYVPNRVRVPPGGTGCFV